MSIFDIVSLFGGVALFLYGMSVMGNGLEKLSGGKMEKALEKLTNNIFTSVALGMVVTALIQSSSATTVIVVGLVNAGILQLRQAVGVIMGANIGTTITAQIIALSDIESTNFMLQLMKPKTLAPIAAIIGIALFMFTKKSKTKEMGRMLLGFGILFAGMFAMEAAVVPLQTSPVFIRILGAMSNPILGVLAGAGITALIQSSSASIGMLQALSSTGVVTFATAFPIIMGQNIGTCITPILSSIGASKNAKRSALIHLYFNILGTAGFLIVMYTLNYTVGLPMWNETIGRVGIANFHTFFNIVVTVTLIPFAGFIEKMARASVKDASETREDFMNLLDARFLKSPSLALQQTMHVIDKMTEFATQNYNDSFKLIDNYTDRGVEKINECENIIDRMEDKLENYLIDLSSCNVTAEESNTITELMHIIKDYERIGDYATNVMECAQEKKAHDIVFSETAQDELNLLGSAVREIIEIANMAYKNTSKADALRVEPLEETIDIMVDRLKGMHVERLKKGECNVHAGIVFLEITTNVERIADHCSNIALRILSICDGNDSYESHVYKKMAQESPDKNFESHFNYYMEKYAQYIANPKVNK